MKKKLLSIVLTLCMVVTMIPLFAGTVFAGDPTITYTGPDGKSVQITSEDIERIAGSEKEFTKMKIDPTTGEPIVAGKQSGYFADLSEVLTDKGATLPDCVYSMPTSDWEFGYQPSSNVCIYVKSGAFNTAVDGGFGFMWAGGITSITGLNHSYDAQSICQNPHTYFRKWQEEGQYKTAKIDVPCGMNSATPEVTFAACTWNGKVQHPAATVKVGGKTLKAGTDYTISYAGGCKNVGSYVATVTCKGNYNGSKTASFDINPKGTKLSKVKAGKKRMTVKWKKQTKKMSTSTINGYQIQYSKKKNFASGNKTAKVKGAKKTSKKITKLQSKKTYYVRIRTYKKVGSKVFYSTWSKAKKVKVK